MIHIVKSIEFCAGHRLMGHEGMCRYLHGHNYRADIRVVGEELDECGRLIDFSLVKRIYKRWIDANWDHGFILNEADHEALDAVGRMGDPRVFTLPGNPTAENLARVLFEVSILINTPRIKVDQITLQEAPGSCATVTL